ncbi:hypothetical protein FisN_9Hh069 [Fistulifera solaris]|uniref:JmjC domain-containing protein n=1 Tax=Fistulifera solaris TaxID=1519565 RepID=A0A1Z5K250_FISSO|nr:hypothetical protein FisN_9Hh069 [Fistulifera solaris]|eukprot:GAX20357.1 hypothetical protein FisN_9Hh069 [Fistulifera solaris]
MLSLLLEQKEMVVASLMGLFTTWLLLWPDHPAPGDRTRLRIVYLQAMIRLRYLLVSWCGLKPFLSPRINGHYNKDQDHAVDIGYVPKIILKIIWFLNGTISGNLGVPGMVLSYLCGFRIFLSLVYNVTHAYILHVCQRDKPEGMEKFLKLPEYDWKNGSPEDFYEKFVKNPRACILRGITKDKMEEFSFDNIVKKYGEEEVMLTRADIGKDYAGKLKEVEDPRVYLVNCETLYNKHPEIGMAANMEQFAPYMKKKPGYCQMFVGKNGTKTPLHCASNWNFFTMFEGSKTWYLIDPENTWFLYPLSAVGLAATFAFPPFPDDYNEKLHPLMKWLPSYKVEVNPGDLLFVPPWWWHAVRNTSEKNVAMASRWVGCGGVGNTFQFTTEDDDVNRWNDFMFYAGFKSWFFMHDILRNPSPMYDEHTTLREKNNRFISSHALATKVGWRF